jgi:hypothetical protein
VLATAVRGDGTVYAGLDPATGTAHPLPVPAGTEQLVRTTGGELTGLAWGDEGTATYLWSDDGGAHWHRAEVPAVGSQPGFRPLLLPWDVPAGAHAVVATSDGATLAPLVAALRLDPSGPGWSTYPAATGPTAYVGATAVLADGRLVSFVDGWSDARQGRAPTPNGLYTSRGEDWSGLQPVAQGTPFDHAPIGSDPTPLALRVSPDGLWVLRAAADGRTAYSSEDLGRSWTEVAMR